MFARIFAATFCFVGLVNFSGAADLPKSKPIPQETIAAYEKLGAKSVWFGVNRYGFYEISSQSELPGFIFQNLPNGKLPKLPAVSVPFGLNLRRSYVTDEAMAELKDLTNLTALDLATTSVSNAGLKPLKDLKSLKYLNLNSAGITDKGLADLKSLKSLTARRHRLPGRDRCGAEGIERHPSAYIAQAGGAYHQ